MDYTRGTMRPGMKESEVAHVRGLRHGTVLATRVK